MVPIPLVLPDVDGSAVSVGRELGNFLTEVIGFFRRYTATHLSRATHLEDPWIYASESADKAISQLSMKGFYRSLIEDGEAALSRCELLDSLPEPRWSSLHCSPGTSAP